jgi:hypothetical protein
MNFSVCCALEENLKTQRSQRKAAEVAEKSV